MKEKKPGYLSFFKFTLVCGLLFESILSKTLWAESTHRPQFEIWTGSLGHLSVTSMAGTLNTQVSFLGTSIGTGLLVGIPNVSIGYHWKYGFEFILTPSLNLLIPSAGVNNQASDGTTLISRLTGGIAYNFSELIQSSYYLRLDSGIAFYTTAGLSARYYVGSLQFGKRFRLTESISLSPNIVFELITTAPHASLGFALTPIQFSLLL